MKTRAIYLMSALGLAGAISITSVSIGHADSQPQTKLPTVVTPTDSSIKEKLTDDSFVEKAALSSMKDVELSKLALQKSQNKKLKKFAQKIVDGSSTTMTKLKQVASSYRLEVPQQLNADQQKMISQMQQLNNQQFDQTYADLMKKGQDTTVGLYDNAAGQSTLNAELRVFANQQLPMLRQNQKLAHALSPEPLTSKAAATSEASTKSRKNSANDS